MRILMISDHADPLAKIGSKEAGGQNVYVMNAAAFLNKLGYDIDVYTRWDSAKKHEVVTVSKGFRVIRVNAGPRAYLARDKFLNIIDDFVAEVQKRIKKESIQYDLVFSHYWFSGIIGLELARLYNLPQTHINHSIGQARFDALQNAPLQATDTEFFEVRAKWERQIAQTVTSMIATSPGEKDDLVKLFNISPSKVACIPIGVDTNVFKPHSTEKARKKTKLPLDQQIILYVGRLEWRKGIGTLLEAFGKLATEWQQAHLYIVGGGATKQSQSLDSDERDRLSKIARELGVENRVHFLGGQPQKHTPYFYAAADVCAVPSYYEPFGIVPLESMACGTPVVGSNTGGLQFTIDEAVTGHKSIVGDATDLASKIHTVLKNGKNSYTHASRDRILTHFTWPKIALNLANHCSDLIQTYKETFYENSAYSPGGRVSTSKSLRWDRADSL